MHETPAQEIDTPTVEDRTPSSDVSCGRRAFLRGATLAALPLAAPLTSGFLGRASAQGAGNDLRVANTPSPVGLITRQRDPDNLEFPFSALNSFITPNELFFISALFGTPNTNPHDWRLQVEGNVDRPFELTYDDLLQMPARTQVATLEDPGNGRVLLNPRERGVQWEMGAVGTAEWTGVPLSAVLDKAGVRAGSVEVLLEGADSGEIRDEPRTPGSVRYGRSLPLDKATQPEVLLAYKMNGKDLPGEHGGPVRAIVPGYYSIASVKWLARLMVSTDVLRTYFQSLAYTYWERRNGVPFLTPIREMQIKSQIARPVMHEVLSKKRDYRVYGAAWTGESDVNRVEVSTDGGHTWADAQLLGTPVKFAWRLWDYKWTTPDHRGRYTLMARATDARNRVQPTQHDGDRCGYMINHVLPIDVDIR